MNESGTQNENWVISQGSELVQGSDEWHAFRRKHIGASDVPGLMGTCDFKTPRSVYDGKLHGETFTGNYATQRGRELEPLVIALLEDRYGIRVTQPVRTYAHWSVLSASLDAFHDASLTAFEIKCPSLEKHQYALVGIVPETYRDQLQAQMLVMGLPKMIYASYHPDQPHGFDLAVFEVQANPARQSSILAQAKLMWSAIESGTWSEVLEMTDKCRDALLLPLTVQSEKKVPAVNTRRKTARVQLSP